MYTGCGKLLQKERTKYGSYCSLQTGVTLIPKEYQIKLFDLVVVESALQPGDSEGGHVAEWNSENTAKASLGGGAGDDDGGL